METEYEARILDIDVDKVIHTLESMGATKKGDYFQRRNLYDFNPKIKGKFIRLRTNGSTTTLAIKDRRIETISGTKEVEIVVEDFDKTNLILNELGYERNLYQENKRLSYVLDDVEFDIDTWPMIPSYLEIEGKNEEIVKEYIEKLELSNNVITCESVKHVYNRYGIDLDSYKELYFEE